MSAHPPPQPASGRLCVLAASVFWSFGGVMAKALVLDPLAIAFYRSLFAGLALVPLVPRSRRVFRPAMIPVVLIFGAMIGAYVSSIARTTAANAILLQCTATFWTIPAGLILFREKPDRRSIAGIGLVTLGIVAIVWKGRDGRPGEGLGLVLGLLSGMGYAAVILGLRGMRAVDSIWLSAVNNLGGALAVGAFALLAAGRIETPRGAQWPLLIAFGVLQMAIPYALFARGLRTIPAAEAGLIALLEPVLNPIWVYLALGEAPAPFTQVGGLFLLAGVAVRYLPRPRRQEPIPPARSTGPDETG